MRSTCCPWAKRTSARWRAAPGRCATWAAAARRCWSTRRRVRRSRRSRPACRTPSWGPRRRRARWWPAGWCSCRTARPACPRLVWCAVCLKKRPPQPAPRPPATSSSTSSACTAGARWTSRGGRRPVLAAGMPAASGRRTPWRAAHPLGMTPFSRAWRCAPKRAAGGAATAPRCSCRRRATSAKRTTCWTLCPRRSCLASGAPRSSSTATRCWRATSALWRMPSRSCSAPRMRRSNRRATCP
mmetsp:Transcript_23755/g.59759  ORF Transcript_23755/g.59759 Transcript_23755/m.59759 type:complete len:242 (+) Transcript_23755:1361-2086(+)